MQSIHPTHAAFLVLGLLLPTACATASVDIESEDESVLFSGGRVSWPFGSRLDSNPGSSATPMPGGDAPQSLAPPRRRRAWIELDYSFGNGIGEQRLGSGEVLIVNGSVFSSPTDLTIGFDLARILVDARIAFPGQRGISTELFGGVEYSALDLSVRDGGLFSFVTAREEVKAIGVAFGSALAWQPRDAFRLSAEGRLGVGLSSQVDTVTLVSLDLGLAVFPFGPLGFFAGWRTVNYQAGAGNVIESDLDLNLSGPVFSLWVRL